MTNSLYLNKPLQADNVFVENSIVNFSQLTGLQSRRGYEKAIISNGKLVNVVSNSYGHLPNEKFFYAVEEKLIDADLDYDVRSVNRNDQAFSVDYILNDDSFHINVKNGKDEIKPMLRFTNSYDGSCKTSGHFGFFRQICTNGLHISQTEIGFSVKHRGNIAEIVLPEIKTLVSKFMDNEFYSLHKKFEVLSERKIENLEGFVKFVADKTKIFTFESSAKNPAPSLNARKVIDIVNKEAREIGTEPNFWLGYNAFNQVLHYEMKKGFQDQYNKDANIFDTVLSIN